MADDPAIVEVARQLTYVKYDIVLHPGADRDEATILVRGPMISVQRFVGECWRLMRRIDER